jgi:hypothetical protein
VLSQNVTPSTHSVKLILLPRCGPDEFAGTAAARHRITRDTYAICPACQRPCSPTDPGRRQVGPDVDRARRRPATPDRKTLLPGVSPPPRTHSGGRRTAGFQPLGRPDNDRSADLRGALLRQVRLRPAAVHAQPRRARGQAALPLLGQLVRSALSPVAGACHP